MKDERMSVFECNYQRSMTVEEASTAFSEVLCFHCGTTTKDLMLKGDQLEVCGDEFAFDIESRERVLTPIALCPECHGRHHLDARLQHNPCQIKARASREQLDQNSSEQESP